MESELLNKLELGRGGKLKWKPIKNCTYNLYLTDQIWDFKLVYSFGLRFWLNSYSGIPHTYIRKGFTIEVGLIFFTINFWLNWDIYQERHKLEL